LCEKIRARGGSALCFFRRLIKAGRAGAELNPKLAEKENTSVVYKSQSDEVDRAVGKGEEPELTAVDYTRLPHFILRLQVASQRTTALFTARFTRNTYCGLAGGLSVITEMGGLEDKHAPQRVPHKKRLDNILGLPLVENREGDGSYRCCNKMFDGLLRSYSAVMRAEVSTTLL